MCGSFGTSLRSASVATIVNRPTTSAGIELSPRRVASNDSSAALRWSAGTARPSRSGSECSTMSAAAPLMKPRNADGEMKLARLPRRSAPISHCIAPTISVTASASWM